MLWQQKRETVTSTSSGFANDPLDADAFISQTQRDRYNGGPLQSALVGPFRAVVAMDHARARARARLVSIYGNGTRIPRHGAPTAAALIYINFRRVYMRINASGLRSRRTRSLSLSLSLSLALFQHSSAKRTGRAFELSTPKFKRRMLDETAHGNKPRHSIAEDEKRPRELFSRRIQVRSGNK